MSNSNGTESGKVPADNPDQNDVKETNAAAENDNDVDTERRETSSDEEQSEEVYEVSKILNARFQRSRIEYHILWETGEKTWEPETCFNEGSEILEQFKLHYPGVMRKLKLKVDAVEMKKNRKRETRKRQMGIVEDIPENPDAVEVFGLAPDQLSEEAKSLYLDKNHKTSETEKKLAEFGFEQRASRNRFKEMLAVTKNDESDLVAEPASSSTVKKRAYVKKTVKQDTPKVRQVKKKASAEAPEPLAVEPDIGATSTSKPKAKPVIRKKNAIKTPRKSRKKNVDIENSPSLENLDNLGSSSSEDEPNFFVGRDDGSDEEDEIPPKVRQVKKKAVSKTPESVTVESDIGSTSTSKPVAKPVNRKKQTVQNSEKLQTIKAPRKPKRKSVDVADSTSLDSLENLGSSSSEEEPKFFVGRDDGSDEDEEMSPFLAAGRPNLTAFKTNHVPSDDNGFIELMTTEPIHKLKAFIAQYGSAVFSQHVVNSYIIHPETKVVTPVFHHLIKLASNHFLDEEKRNEAMVRLTVVCQNVDAVVFATPDNSERDYPIHLAAKCGSLEVVKLLASCGSKLMDRRENNMMPIDCAIDANHPEIFKFLITQGATFHQIYNNPDHPARDLVNRNMRLTQIYDTMMKTLEAAGKRARRDMLPNNLKEMDDKYPIMIHNRREGDKMTFSFYRNEEYDNKKVYLLVFVPMVYDAQKEMWLEKHSMLELRAGTDIKLNKVKANPLKLEDPEDKDSTPSMYCVLPDEEWNDIELTLSPASWDTEQVLTCKFISCKILG